MKRLAIAIIVGFFSTGAFAQYLTPAVNSNLFPSTPSAGQFPIAQSTTTADWKSMSGDATLAATGGFTLATVNSNVGSFGSATQCVSFTTNGKGLITAASATACTPGLASITGLGTGVATALGNTANAAGGFALFSSGTNTNTLNSQVISYTVASTDCGKTVQAGTGSTGFFTLTLPSVSGFPTTCVVTVKNGDTARGKLLSGFPSDLGAGFNILWPSQTAVVGIVNGAWATLLNPSIWQASGSVILNVDHAAGSDTNNDCLGTGAGACATIYHAYLMMQTVVRPGSGGSANITDSNTGETFTETPPAAFLGPTLTAGNQGGVLFLNLNTAIWNTAGINIDDGAVIAMNGGTIQCSGSGQTAVSVPKGGLFVIQTGLIFGACPAGAQMQVFNGANIVADSGYTVSAIGNYHVICNSGGNFSVAGKTISVPNALSFNSWISGNGACNANFAGTTFTGTGAGAGSTGNQYDFHSNANIFLSGATLPGATAGTIDTGACKDLAGSCAGLPITAHNVVLGNGNGVYNSAAVGTANRVLTDNGGSADPTFKSATHFIFGNSPSLVTNTSNFCGVATCGGGNGSTTFIPPLNGTYRNLYVIASATPVAGQTFTITINDGGLTSVTCTISNPATTCNDTTHTASHTAGNGAWVEIVLSTTAGSQSFAYSVELDTP